MLFKIGVLRHLLKTSVINARNMSCFAENSYRIDRFNCCQIDFESFSQQNPSIGESNVDNFERLLIETTKQWREKGIRASWFRMPLNFSHFIPSLVKARTTEFSELTFIGSNGYVYHHAKRDFVMLLKWLSDDVNNIPHYPFTSIGVGGIVVDDNHRVLMVKEKYHLVADYWKFPGGYSNPGEEFGETAQREVFEETGIKTEFQSLVVLRHHHKFQFDCADIYILCALKPIKTDENPNLELKLCQRELTDAAWIPEDQIIDKLSPFNRFSFEKYLSCRRKNTAISLDKVDGILNLGKQSVYSINFDNKF